MIFIDHRSGSEEIITYPPFSTCHKCLTSLKIARDKRSEGRILSATCPKDPRHRTLRQLVNLNKIDGHGENTSADVGFDGNGPDGLISVRIEVKKLSDLLTSLENGRLVATQIPGLIRSGDERWLLYYGAYQENPYIWRTCQTRI